jgi:glycosyltransferase involved in cell wall biosynthesis
MLRISDMLRDIMPDGPLVTIVTPCHNSVAFLATAIESVLSQDYPHIDYLVMDGGSTDGCLDVLKGYGDRLRYVSAADDGAADAINQGFHRSQGEILGWLSADDSYLPGAVSAVVRTFMETPGADIVCGDAYWCDSSGRACGAYPTRHPTWASLQRDCCICQPACFFRRSAFETIGGLDVALKSAYDYDLWIRFSRVHTFAHLEKDLAVSRMHPASKTLGKRHEVYKEAIQILRRHYQYVPFSLIHSHCCYMVDGRDQFYQPLDPTLPKYLLSLLLGSWYNRRKMPHFIREWASVMTMGALKRQLRRMATLRELAPEARAGLHSGQ